MPRRDESVTHRNSAFRRNRQRRKDSRSYTFRLRRSLNLGMASVGNSPGELGIRGELAVGASAASFEAFFRGEQLRLHQVLFAITGSRPEAEDIGQRRSSGFGSGGIGSASWRIQPATCIGRRSTSFAIVPEGSSSR
jgi:hypothetical protein